ASASVTSRIWLAVRFRMLAKIEVWFSSRNVQKAIANTSPKYLAGSPVSILKATKFMGSSSAWVYRGLRVHMHIGSAQELGRRGERTSSSSRLASAVLYWRDTLDCTVQSNQTGPFSLGLCEILHMAGTKKRARRGAARKGSKRGHGVDAPTRLFLDEGYGTTGMDAIAKAADVSKATLYSYYDDKASLFADVMLRMCNEIGGHYVEASYEDSPEAVLRSVARFLIARMFETLDRRLLQRVVAEAKEFPELGKKFWATGPGKLEDSVAAYLADA